MDEELIVLVDEAGNEVGTAPKLASHHANTPLHKAFSCYIFNDQGELLVTKRAQSKKVWPGVITNSVCGHPGPGESDETAIQRRARDELGMSVADIKLILPDYRYQTPLFNGVVENELCPVYVARSTDQVAPNPSEVESFWWQPWFFVVNSAQAEPDKYSYWFKDQMPKLSAHKEFLAYINPEH